MVASGLYDAFTSKAANSVPLCVSFHLLIHSDVGLRRCRGRLSPPCIPTVRIEDHHPIILGVDAADSAFDWLRGDAFVRGICWHTRDGDLWRREFRMLSKRFGQCFQEGLFFALVKSALAMGSRNPPN